MKAMTRDGREFELGSDAILSLKTRVKGPVLMAGEAGYEESRTVWNAMIDRKPALICRCLGTADIIAGVQFAREHDLLLCIKGGGHNIAGLATADGSLMLDMSLMRGVWVDPERRIARIQPGCLLADVDRETQVHGLAAVLGFVSLTGAVGLTLGGGFGYLTRRWGWTTDNVVGFDMLTADGRLVRASNDQNPELFWGLQGGGGNFGVVTGIDFSLHPVGPEIVGGIVAWPVSEAPQIIELYRSLIAKAPRELTLVLFIRPAPPAPWLPATMHGKPIVALLACYSGKPEDGERLAAPIKSHGAPIGDILIRRPYVQLQSMLDATQPKGRRYYWKSEYLAGVEPALAAPFMEHASQIPSPHSAMILFQIDGALNELAEGHSAVGNRDARYVLNISGSWEQHSQDEANIAWARNAWGDLRKFSTGGTYVNFLNQEEGPERTADALRTSLQRLRTIKGKWDPDNIFRMNRNIVPA